MPICEVCGALNETEKCPYDVDEENAPWQGDYNAMNQGLMTHEEHALIVARWGLHNPTTQSDKAIERFQTLCKSAWGKPQALYSL